MPKIQVVALPTVPQCWSWLVFIFYLQGRGMRRLMNRKFSSMIQFPDVFNIEGWARLRSEARTLIWVSHVGGRDPGSWDVSYCYPQCSLTWSWVRSRGAGPEQGIQKLDVVVPSGNQMDRTRLPLCDNLSLRDYSLKSLKVGESILFLKS